MGEQTVVIAGATGYVGSALARAFLDRGGVHLILVARDAARLDSELAGRAGVSVCLSDDSALDKAFAAMPPRVIYCATCCYPHDSSYLRNATDANYCFPSRLLRAAISHAGRARFISVGTSLPERLNLYALTKQQFARLGRYFHSSGLVEFLNVKLENYYGLNEPPSRFITRSLLQLASHKPLELTAGTQRRDFIFIDDVIDILVFLSGCDTSVLSGAEFDIPAGSGDAPFVREIIEFLHRETRSRSELRFGALPMREGEPDTRADLTLLRRLGFTRALTPWREGMKLLCGA